MRANYGKLMRKYFTDNGNIAQLIDFGDAPFFENATTYTNILVWGKNGLKTGTKAWDLSKVRASNMPLDALLAQHGEYEPLFNENSFVVVKGAQSAIKKKIEEIGIPLKNWDIAINYGIKTGLNEAFIIDSKKKDELVAEDPKSAEILKPILRGRDVKKYKADWARLWLISTLPALQININDYSSVKRYLDTFGERIKQTGKKGCRKKTNNKWFEIQDTIAYYPEIENEKILCAEIVFDSAFYYDTKAYYPDVTSFIITGERLKFLTAMLNSKLLTYAFKKFYAGGDLRGNTFRYKKIFLERLPIPRLSPESQRPFELVVDQILSAKQSDPGADTTALEREIDQMVYALYGLTAAEIAIVEGK